MPRIALLGDRNENYPSHREVDAVIPLLGVSAEWVATDSSSDLGQYDGIWLMPGSPYADDASAYAAITYAREHSVPFLGTCGGLQYAVVEYFRQVIGVADASHAESDGPSESNVVTAQACSLFGEEREVLPVAGTRFADMVPGPFVGMHYCNYAPSSEALHALVAHGWVIAATAQDAEAEVLELPGHPYFMLSLFQPQIGSLAGKPLHPMLREFVRCTEVFAASRPAVTGGQR